MSKWPTGKVGRLDCFQLKQARNLERCALKAAKLQHGKLKTLHTWLIPIRNAECGKIKVRLSLRKCSWSYDFVAKVISGFRQKWRKTFQIDLKCWTFQIDLKCRTFQIDLKCRTFQIDGLTSIFPHSAFRMGISQVCKVFSFPCWSFSAFKGHLSRFQACFKEF